MCVCMYVCMYIYMIINDITFTTMAKQPPPEPHKN